jgi:Leucine-rich repeat (LRR) protein
MEGGTSSDGGVVDLTGGANGKLSELPIDLIPVATTTQLKISTNKLKELPPFLGTLTRLLVLDCSDNWLTALPPELDQCEQLEELLFYKNSLKALPKELGALRSLKVLNAFNNAITRLPPDLGQLPALEEVNLAANKMMALPDVPGWSNVRVLNLYDNRLVKLGSLACCTALCELRLFNNNLEAMPTLPPAEGNALEILEMNNNRIAAIDEDYFLATPRLRRLALAANQLTRLPSSLATGCPVLQFLLVGDNQLAELPSMPSAGTLCWPQLETLFLERNPITHLPAELAISENLLRCNLTGTQIAPDDDLAQALLTSTLKRPGGSFWSVNGRRWVSDEARAASFAVSKSSVRGMNVMEGLAALGIGPAADAGGGAAEKARAAAAAAEEEEEVSTLVCDMCEEQGRETELRGDEHVYVCATGDLCAACHAQLGADAGEGKWMTAQQRIEEATAEAEAAEREDSDEARAAEAEVEAAVAAALPAALGLVDVTLPPPDGGPSEAPVRPMSPVNVAVSVMRDGEDVEAAVRITGLAESALRSPKGSAAPIPAAPIPAAPIPAAPIPSAEELHAARIRRLEAMALGSVHPPSQWGPTTPRPFVGVAQSLAAVEAASAVMRAPDPPSLATALVEDVVATVQALTQPSSSSSPLAASQPLAASPPLAGSPPLGASPPAAQARTEALLEAATRKAAAAEAAEAEAAEAARAATLAAEQVAAQASEAAESAEALRQRVAATVAATSPPRAPVAVAAPPGRGPWAWAESACCGVRKPDQSPGGNAFDFGGPLSLLLRRFEGQLSWQTKRHAPPQLSARRTPQSQQPRSPPRTYMSGPLASTFPHTPSVPKHQTPGSAQAWAEAD